MKSYKTDLAYTYKDFMAETELKELLRALRGLHRGQAGENAFLEHITGTQTVHEFSETLLRNAVWFSPKERQKSIIRYYIYCGVAIQKIANELNTSQATVYKLKDKEWSQTNELTPLLLQFPQIRYNISRLRESINILGGYSYMQ